MRKSLHTLKEHLSNMIEECAKINIFKDANDLSQDNVTYVTSYRSFSTSGDFPLLSDTNYAFDSLPEGILESCVKLKSFSPNEIETIFFNGKSPSREYLTSIIPKNPLCSLIDTYTENNSYWLHFSPCGVNIQTKPWTIWQVPRFKVPDIENITVQHKVVKPKWLYQQSNVEFVEDMIWPSSPNRFAYWQDTFRKIWSIMNSLTDDFIIFCVNDHEFSHVENVLIGAELTVGYKVESDSIFRKCETIKNAKKKLAITSHSKCSDWIEAALAWNLKPSVIIESLPITQWWMCSHSQDMINSELFVEKRNTDNIKSDDDIDINTQVDDDNLDSIDDSNIADGLQICQEQFLLPWINSVIKTPHNIRTILLDSRINTFYSSNIIQEEYHYLDLPITLKGAIARNKYNFGVIDRQSAPIDYIDYQNFLKKYWGYDDFKEGTQKPVIYEIIRNDKDVLVRLPTGEGKSVLFHVPALLRGMRTQRLTVVITPLRALMRDQVSTLWKLGFYQSVDYLSGDREIWESNEVYQGIIDNRIKLLFVAPERFRVQRFRDAIYRRISNDNGLEYIVFDEAHCVSQWGFQFRPDYLFAINEIRNLRLNGKLPDTSLLMFSATITELVRRDLFGESGTTNMVLILCRTNQEALNIYQELKSNYPNISLQGQANVDLSWTRSVGSWIDCCQEYLNTFENGQYTKDIFDYICTNYSKSQIPEANDIHKPYDLEWLRKASMQENPYLTLIEHLSFLHDLKVEDYIRIYGRRQQRKQIIISTIHKVKGLEFDNVCVLSSKSKFQPDYNDVKRCVADEVRLYYVAITRAKQNIFFEWSEREKKWAKAESFNSNNNEQLSQFQGSPDEIFISWSGFDDSRQAYLEEKVRVGDQLLLSNKSILHNRTQIAKLKNNINVNDNIDLCIADVIRYPIAEDMPFYRNNPDIYKNIIPRCKERGWLYIPLISNT